jgi:hypothetical protein
MAVSLVNDEYEAAQGKLVLSVEAGDKILVRREMDVEVGPLGQQTYITNLSIPSQKGPCVVKAAMRRTGATTEVVSQRRTVIE